VRGGTARGGTRLEAERRFQGQSDIPSTRRAGQDERPPALAAWAELILLLMSARRATPPRWPADRGSRVTLDKDRGNATARWEGLNDRRDQGRTRPSTRAGARRTASRHAVAPTGWRAPAAIGTASRTTDATEQQDRGGSQPTAPRCGWVMPGSRHAEERRRASRCTMLLVGPASARALEDVEHNAARCPSRSSS